MTLSSHTFNLCSTHVNDLSVSGGKYLHTCKRVERINWFLTKGVPNELSESTGSSVCNTTCVQNELSASTGFRYCQGVFSCWIFESTNIRSHQVQRTCGMILSSYTSDLCSTHVNDLSVSGGKYLHTCKRVERINWLSTS